MRGGGGVRVGGGGEYRNVRRGENRGGGVRV